jgi:hypothetical protein
VAAGGARRRQVKELQRENREELRHVSRTDTGLHACVVLGSKLESFLTRSREYTHTHAENKIRHNIEIYTSYISHSTLEQYEPGISEINYGSAAR